jgi:hypothetical protein
MIKGNSLGGAGKAEEASGAGRMVYARSSAKQMGKKWTERKNSSGTRLFEWSRRNRFEIQGADDYSAPLRVWKDRLMADFHAWCQFVVWRSIGRATEFRIRCQGGDQRNGHERNRTGERIQNFSRVIAGAHLPLSDVNARQETGNGVLEPTKEMRADQKKGRESFARGNVSLWMGA